MPLFERAGRASGPARGAVERFGDPRVSWSIVLQAELTEPIDPELVRARLRVLARQWPHLGTPPAVEHVADACHLGVLRTRFASASYRPDEPLIRVAVGRAEPVLLLAAHHSIVDGLGLLALLGAALDTEVSSTAAGIGERRARRPFLLSAVYRVGEALLVPPTRVAAEGGRPHAGEDSLACRHQPRQRLGTALLTDAATRTTEHWNRERGSRARRIVAAIGASRRDGDRPTPEDASAFFRLRMQRDPHGRARTVALNTRRPEPDIPARGNPLGTLVTRSLAGRLGSTFLVSNLGEVNAGGLVRNLAFYPTASGRSGVAFGAVTVGATTTITTRTRHRDFDEHATAHLADALSDTVRVIQNDPATAGRAAPHERS